MEVMNLENSSQKFETMTLETAAPLYDVKLPTLRLMCTRRKIDATKVGKHWYVTRAAMDAVFKGVVAGDVNASAKRRAKSVSR
jgi:excisionase family DNA binding protein